MPSEKVLLQKKEKVAILTEKIKAACSGVLVDYKGISVANDTKLRKELREAGVQYTVEKNSVIRFALENAGLKDMTENLAGTTAIALSDNDQTAPARIFGKYIKSAGDNSKFSMKCGFVDGEIFDEKGVIALSNVPSKDILLSQLVGSLQGSITNLACTIKAVAEKLETEQA